MKKTVALLLGLSISVLGSAGTASAATGSQRFQLVFRGEHSTVVAAGPITGVGTVVDREGGDDGSFLVSFVLADGTVDVTVTPVEETFDFNSRACVGHLRIVEAFEVTGGTGPYQEATGTGTFAGRGTFIFPRDARGGCLGPDAGVAPTLAVSVLSGTGQVTVP